MVGFGGQYRLAARVVLAKLRTLEWIRVADPEAGVADDFQFKSGPRRHALQVKWSQLPGSFTWSDLTSGERGTPGLLTKLAGAWRRLRAVSPDPLTVYLCTNNHASSSAATGATPIALAAATGTPSLASFLARSFEPVRLEIAQGTTRWSDLARLPEVEQWATVWEALRALTELTDEEFVGFVRDLELKFGLQLDDPLVRPDHYPADREVAHLAQTLMDIVRDPAQPVELSREQLMDRLGWSERLRYRHPHRFPVPTVYATNEAARRGLESRLSRLPGGYMALVGPAGSGKSTLLASLSLPGHVARYYAFVPDAPDPLSSRGEADSFLHDLSLALEESGLYRRGIGNDLRTQRAVLLEQLDHAGQRWTERGERTVIVVDGLDHIPREQNPTRSLLEELPAPAALPEGVFVILGTQTVTILPPPVRMSLEHDDRIATLPPLSAEEVKHLADAAGVGKWLYPGQLTTLVEASEGHPLALTYVLQELHALEASEPDIAARHERADRLLADASSYGGDIALRYRGYFQAVSGDQDVLDLLGMVARLRVPVNLAWLSTWAEPHAVSAFADRTATFFRQTGADWQFIHNSFRRFLADETTRVALRLDETRDRQFHEKLADVCAHSGHDWSLYREEEIAHRFLAGQHDRVLELATPDRLRQSLLDLRPSGTVRDHALLALRSATQADDTSAFRRTLLFINELWLRDMALKTDSLAEAVVTFDPRLALEHIVRGGRLRIEPAAALDHAAGFAANGDVDAAQRILRACGGLAGLTADEHPAPPAVANWAEVTWRLSGLDSVLAELDHHLPLPTTDPAPSTDTAEIPGDVAIPDDERWRRERHLRDLREREDNTIHCRNLVHARCFDLLVETRDEETLEALTTIIDAEASPDWRARARFMRAKAASQDRARADTLGWIRAIIDIGAASTELTEDDEEMPAPGPGQAVPLGIRSAAAELLVRNGFNDTPDVDLLVPPGTAVSWPSTTSGQDGLAPFRTLLRLNSLREAHPDPTRPDPMPAGQGSTREVGNERFRRALRTLAQLEGQQLVADAGLGAPPVVAAHVDPIIRLLEVPPEETRDWTAWYIVQDAALDLFRHVVDLAAESGGSDGLTRLLARFDDAWTTPDRRRYWTPERQQAVIIAAVNADHDAVPWAIERLETLDTEINTRSYDPHDRVSLWLTQARAWATAGNLSAARQAARSAVQASLGIGISDHDRQLAEWLDWLSAAVNAGQVDTTGLATTVRAYASRIASAAAEAENQAEAAAERLIALVFPTDVSQACDLAEWLCETGALGEADTIQAVVLAACNHPEIPIGHGGTAAAHLLYPIMREPAGDVADAVQARSIEDSGDALTTLRHAAQVWTVHDAQPGSTETQQDQAESAGTPTDDGDESPRIETIGALLTALRNAETAAHAPEGGWDQAVERTATATVPGPMARALLEQASRLHLEGAAIGGLAALAARAGEADFAADVLADALSRTSGYGWLRYTDGGTRLTIFDAALRDRHPVLVRLARNDLANSLATGSLSGQLSPDSLRRVIELVAGPQTVANAWPDIEAYLDEVVPADADMPNLATNATEERSPVEAFAGWVARYLGHPVRPLDFGARRTLQVISHHHPRAGQRVLAEAITQAGWTGEAALMTLITTPNDERPAALSSDLVAALQATAVGPDGISRDLAGRLGYSYRVQLTDPPHRPLAASYGLALPPMPARTAPELDRHGTPHLDPHNPQDLLAPFDLPLRVLATMSGLDHAAVLHRAATIAEANDDRWTQGGHHTQANLLKSRQQRHTYRPWAFMAGRRALGVVLAELHDANAIGDLPSPPAYYLGLVGGRIAALEPQPVPSSVPPPWRPEGTPSFSVQGWCTETTQAVQEYRNSYSATDPYVLAEHGHWRSLEWSTPGEERRVYTTHRDTTGGRLILPAERAWEITTAGAHRYPHHLQLEWNHEELVLHGHEYWTDPPRFEWLALHPAVGAQLGWQHDPQQLFTWKATDGKWRARTVLLARGQLSHQPPAHTSCAEIWQVQLSKEGHTELLTAFPTLTRSLEVTRTLPANMRERRPEPETSTSRTDLSEIAAATRGQT